MTVLWKGISTARISACRYVLIERLQLVDDCSLSAAVEPGVTDLP